MFNLMYSAEILHLFKACCYPSPGQDVPLEQLLENPPFYIFTHHYISSICKFSISEAVYHNIVG